MKRQDRAEEGSRWRLWLIALPTIGVVVLAAAWSGFWYVSAGKAQASLDEWRMREANAGRVYRCDQESFGGFPFRIEMDCRNPLVEDRATQLTLHAGDLKAVAQVWESDPADRRDFGTDDGGPDRRRPHHDDEMDARPGEPAGTAGVVATVVHRG